MTTAVPILPVADVDLSLTWWARDTEICDPDGNRVRVATRRDPGSPPRSAVVR